MDKEPITRRGLQALVRELADLKKIQRPQVIAAIAGARAHGDLKENAEYHAAREQQGFLEARIRALEALRSGAQVIDPSTLAPNGRVIFGASVKLLHISSGRILKYQIVGNYEADVDAGRISFNSPVARALLGKQKGDEVTVKTPEGEVDYEIISVSYPPLDATD